MIIGDEKLDRREPATAPKIIVSRARSGIYNQNGLPRAGKEIFI
jgi:hypothetical protein